MPQTGDLSADPAVENQAVQLTRVLMASPVGRLAIEFHGTVVTRLIIKPSAKVASEFTPLDKIKLDDFLLEALGGLSEYLSGLRTNSGLEFDLSHAELDDFTRRVLKTATRIGYGKTWTYSRVADSVGLRGGYRKVQAALLLNPIAILVPCHRVVPAKGGAGAYIAGTKNKEKLLEVERQTVAANQQRS